jgi:Tol biopolymer transport system component/tetratricopeptide (TPR) repeat protein
MMARPGGLIAVSALVLLTGCGSLGLFGYGGGEVRPLRDWVQGEKGAWQEAIQLTTNPAEDSNADLSRDGRWLVFVSNRQGGADLWLQDLQDAGLAPPEMLTTHPAVDTWPRLEPGGRRVAFCSTRDDAGGDIWLTGLEGEGRELDRLTGTERSETEPAWFAAGGGVLCTGSREERDRALYRRSLPGRGLERVTPGEGSSGDVSPDGRWLVFVSRRADPGGDLWLMNVETKKETALTTGPALDAFPRWAADGRRIVFVRYDVDTDGDGAVTTRDTSSLWLLALEAGKAGGAAYPLTSHRHSELFPALRAGVLLFTSNRGQSLDVWALPEWGELPRFERLSALLAWARAEAQKPLVDPWRVLLAYRAVTAAAAEGPAREWIAFDLKGLSEVAEVQLEIGRLFAGLGRRWQARREFERVISAYPGEELAGAEARVELARLAREELEAKRLPAEAMRAGLAGQVAELEAMAEAHSNGAARERRRIAAQALVEAARTQVALGRYPEALNLTGRVTGSFGAQRRAAAEALLVEQRVYRVLGDPDSLRTQTLRVLTDYGDVSGARQKAATNFLTSVVAGEEQFARKAAALRQVVDRYKEEQPYLAATAQNRIGDLYYERRELGRAKDEYSRTAKDFSGEEEPAARAQLSLARVYYDQQDYGACVDIYRELLKEHGEYEDRVYRLAREAFVKRTLEKAARDLELGDPRLALGTYVRLLRDYDPQNVRGHRGLVDCYARIGDLATPGRRYADALQEDPRNDVAYYGLARTVSYKGPNDWVGDSGKSRERRRLDGEAVALMRRALLLRAQVPYYHQLLGFLYERLSQTERDPEAELRYASLALESYVTALSLSDPEDDPTNHADLVFNVAEGFRLIGNREKAYVYYRKALEASIQLRSELRRLVVREKGGEWALAAGDYEFAVHELQSALEVLEARAEPEDAAAARQRLVHQARLRDQLALAYRLGDKFGAAAGELRKLLTLLDRMEAMASTRSEKAQIERNRLRAQRNLALNLYRSVEAGRAGAAALVEARGLLEGVLERLPRVGVGSAEEAKALGTIRIELGGRGAFDEDTEARLLHTYLARIYAESGNYARAVGHLEKKLALYDASPKKHAQVAIEMAVIHSQIGGYELELGRAPAAAAAFEEARALDREGGNLHGEVVNAVNWGSAVLRLRSRPDPAVGPEKLVKLLDETIAAQQETLAACRRAGKDYAHPEWRTILSDSLVKLLSWQARLGRRAEGERSRIKER